MNGKKTAPWNDRSIRWVCENHPEEDQGHMQGLFFPRECGAAGMPDPKTHDNMGQPIKKNE